LNLYQTQAARTLADPDDMGRLQTRYLSLVFGLFGEVGEVTELVKKGIFHKHGIDVPKLKIEIGDILWYLAGLCTISGLDLDDVMAANIAKLMKRYPKGFCAKDSMNRKGEEV